MSVYSGFSTRKMEQVYSKQLYNTLYLLQLKISKNIKNEAFDENRFAILF